MATSTKDDKATGSLIRTVKLPSPTLVLRSAALVGVLIASLAIALASWIVFYRSLSVSKGHTEPIYLQYGHERPPFAHVKLNGVLVSGQAYDVSLLLTVPASNANLDLGNFMVALRTYRADGSMLTNVSRPGSLVWTAPPPRYLYSIVPFFGTRPKQHLTIPILKSEVLQWRSAVPTLAEVEVGRGDAKGELHTYSAKLKLDAHLTGLRWMLYHHPILAFLIYFPSFLFFELLAAAVLWGTHHSRQSSAESEEASGSQKRVPSQPSSSDVSDQEQQEREEANQRRRELSGIKMEYVEGSEDDDASSVGTEGLLASPPRQHRDLDEVKSEEDEDSSSTIQGSATTASRTSTFGPSVASTSATSASSSSVRGRSGFAGDV